MPLPPRDHRLDPNAAPSLAGLAIRSVRRRSDGLLVSCAISGIVAAAIVLIAWPDRWTLAAPAMMIAATGCWGVADRMVSDHARLPDDGSLATPVALAALRILCATVAVGSLAATILILAVRTVITTGGGWF